jgi:uncharacterized protein
MQQLDDNSTCEHPETEPDWGAPRGVLAGVQWAVGSVLIVGVRFYQLAIRPFLPPSCRFHPSCSEYFIEAVRKYGPISGACRGTWRICRCHPWNEGGYDPP